MPEIVKLDNIVHQAHPDEENKTFCGEKYTVNTADKISYRSNYANNATAMEARDSDEICDECLEKGKKWAKN